MAVLSAA